MCLLCRPNRSLSNPVNEYEYTDSGFWGVAMTNMTKKPSYVTAKEVVTSFAPGTEEKEAEHTDEELPFEAHEEGQEGTTDSG